MFDRVTREIDEKAAGTKKSERHEKKNEQGEFLPNSTDTKRRKNGEEALKRLGDWVKGQKKCKEGRERERLCGRTVWTEGGHRLIQLNLERRQCPFLISEQANETSLFFPLAL